MLVIARALRYRDFQPSSLERLVNLPLLPRLQNATLLRMVPNNTLSQNVLSQPEILEHWQDESNGAYLYGKLAPLMRDPDHRAALERLVTDETAHAEVFAAMLGRAPTLEISTRTKLLLLSARFLGPKIALSLARLEEGREVERFLREAQTGKTSPELQRLARESAGHAQLLGRLTGVTGDPWHHNDSGGTIRNVVYGFNDGLTAN